MLLTSFPRHGLCRENYSKGQLKTPVFVWLFVVITERPTLWYLYHKKDNIFFMMLLLFHCLIRESDFELKIHPRSLKRCSISWSQSVLLKLQLRWFQHQSWNWRETLLQSRSEIIYIQHKLSARLSLLFLLPRSTTGTWFVKLTLQSKDESHVMYS